MLTRSFPVLLVSALCLTAAAPVRADVFKWIDERGVVNYGDRPPPRAESARALDIDVAGTAVLPGIPKEELQTLRERDAERRLRQLEAEVDALRAQASARPATPAPESAESDAEWFPVYGYPAYGYGRLRNPRPIAVGPVRPAHRISMPLAVVRIAPPHISAPRIASPRLLPVRELPIAVRR